MTNQMVQEQIGDFVGGIGTDWSKPAGDAVLLALVDTLAVALAARNEPTLGRVLDYARALEEPAVAPVWCGPVGLAPETAALVNGVAAHALDYDDVAPSWRGHASAVLFAALLALPEMQKLTGSDLLDAYAVGFEVGARVGRCCADAQYRAGWHTTATIGVIAATVACCRALRLASTTTSAAIGLAVAQAAGPQANFGTMAKSLHAGLAAAAAVRAVRLARLGIGASPVALQGPGGFIDLYGGADPATAFRDLGEAAPIAAGDAIERKTWPICYAAHRAAEAVRVLKAEHGFAAAAVRSVEIEGSAGSHKALLGRPPAGGLEAKFSLEYAVALLLVDSVISLESFSEAAFARRDIHEMMSRVGLTEISGRPTPRSSRVTIALCDGRLYEHTVEALGQDESNARLLAKLADCLSFGGWADRSRELYETVRILPGQPVATLLRFLAQRPAPATPLRPVAEIAL
ncbi:MAG: MmgE/PrpD family protein [Hyphomicrobiaceae bacterium]|nr:MmgE/PrpD family protein [Hyphomicrobiaceae bacterium]